MGIEPLELVRNILRTIIVTSQQGNYSPSGVSEVKKATCSRRSLLLFG